MPSGFKYPLSRHGFGCLWIIDGILFIKFNPGVFLDLPMAMALTRARLRFQEEKEYPIFCEIDGLIGSRLPARNHLAKLSSHLIRSVVFYTKTKEPARLRLFLEQEKARIKIPYLITGDKTEGIHFLKSQSNKKK